jgi:tetratricopeptide (TPR) repeat protein
MSIRTSHFCITVNDTHYCKPSPLPYLLLVVVAISLMLAAGCTPISPVQQQAVAGSASQQPVAAPIIARLTYFTGDVSVDEPTASVRPPGLLKLIAPYQLQHMQTPQTPQRPRPMQGLADGARVNVSAGGSATVVSFDNHVRTVDPGSQTVNKQWTKSGQKLPSTSCQQTTGTVCQQSRNAVAFQPEKDRESDYGNFPVILSPRGDRLFDLQPVIQWVAMNNARDYKLQLDSNILKVSAADVVCAAEESETSDLVCSIAWPAAWQLEPDKRYSLVVAARRKVDEEWRMADKSSKTSFRTLDTETAQHLQDDIVATRALGLDPLTEKLVLASLFVSHTVQSQAILLYEEIARQTPAAALYNTLGDLYRQIELQRYAIRAYNAGLSLLDNGEDDPPVRATAQFGIGQAEFSRQRYHQAEPYFTEAVALYAQMPVQEEYAAAEYALGQISEIGKHYDAAEQHYHRAIELYGTLGLTDRVEEMETALADMKERLQP